MLLERDIDNGRVTSKATPSISLMLLVSVPSRHFPRDERPKLNGPLGVSDAMSLSHDSLLSRDVYSGSEGTHDVLLRGVRTVLLTKQLTPRLASSSFSSSVQSAARPTNSQW